MTWRHLLGVFVGSVFAVVFCLAIGMAMGIVMLIYYTSQGATMLQATKHMDSAHLAASMPFLLSSLGGGAFASLLSGCLGAWISRTYPVLTGLATGIAACVLSLPFSYFGTYPLWYNVAGVIVTLLPAAMGGYLARVLASLRPVPLPAAS